MLVELILETLYEISMVILFLSITQVLLCLLITVAEGSQRSLSLSVMDLHHHKKLHSTRYLIWTMIHSMILSILRNEVNFEFFMEHRHHDSLIKKSLMETSVLRFQKTVKKQVVPSVRMLFHSYCQFQLELVLTSGFSMMRYSTNDESIRLLPTQR